MTFGKQFKIILIYMVFNPTRPALSMSKNKSRFYDTSKDDAEVNH